MSQRRREPRSQDELIILSGLASVRSVYTGVADPPTLEGFRCSDHLVHLGLHGKRSRRLLRVGMFLSLLRRGELRFDGAGARGRRRRGLRRDSRFGVEARCAGPSCRRKELIGLLTLRASMRLRKSRSIVFRSAAPTSFIGGSDSVRLQARSSCSASAPTRTDLGSRSDHFRRRFYRLERA